MRNTFTVEQILQAAEQSNFPNTNDAYVAYKDRESDWWETPRFVGQQPYKACVIGEAFINLGMVPNGISPYTLSYALQEVKPDGGTASVEELTFRDLSEFINTLNGIKGYRGKKRIPKLIRKYFSQSLNQKVSISV